MKSVPYATDDELSAMLQEMTRPVRSTRPADLVVMFVLGAMTTGVVIVLGRGVLSWIS